MVSDWTVWCISIMEQTTVIPIANTMIPRMLLPMFLPPQQHEENSTWWLRCTCLDSKYFRWDGPQLAWREAPAAEAVAVSKPTLSFSFAVIPECAIPVVLSMESKVVRLASRNSLLLSLLLLLLLLFRPLLPPPPTIFLSLPDLTLLCFIFLTRTQSSDDQKKEPLFVPRRCANCDSTNNN